MLFPVMLKLILIMLVICGVVIAALSLVAHGQTKLQGMGAYPTSSPHNAPDHFVGQRRPIPARESNPYVDAFWAMVARPVPSLRTFSA
jgi:hypothetical protein